MSVGGCDTCVGLWLTRSWHAVSSASPFACYQAVACRTLRFIANGSGFELSLQLTTDKFQLGFVPSKFNIVIDSWLVASMSKALMIK